MYVMAIFIVLEREKERERERGGGHFELRDGVKGHKDMEKVVVKSFLCVIL